MPTEGELDAGTTSALVSADDLKAFQESLTSSVSTEMKQMREMIAQLMKAQKDGVPLPSHEEPTSPNAAAANVAAEAEAKVAEDGVGKEQTSESTKKGDNHKIYNESQWFSPDPPVPHPHITHRGDPPRLSDHSFAQWQYLMKSHVQSSCIDLWTIIMNGLHVADPSNLTRREVVDSQLDA